MTIDDGPALSDELVPPFLTLLVALRDACGGDLEKNIILLAVAARTIPHPDFASLTNVERLASSAPEFPSLGVNVRSIADSTGVPRETVRRKIADLVDAGWIRRSGRNLHLTPEAYRALTPARSALEHLARQFHAIVAQRAAGRSELISAPRGKSRDPR